MKVLFCTDGSKISRFAIEKVLTLIKKDFKIDIANVMETGLLSTFITFPYEVETGFLEYKNESEKLLEDSKNFIESKGFKVGNIIQLNGDPADMIINLIYENDYTAVVLGSHGKKGIKSWLGSVSRKIAHKSPIPILIVKPTKNYEINEKNKKEILITVDGTENSYKAIRKASEIIDLKDGYIEILSVKVSKEDFPIEIREDMEWLGKCMKKQDEITEEIFKKTNKILQEYNISPALQTALQGNPAEEILKYTQKNYKDIIIMSSHGREGLASLLIGSVSKIILDNTNTSVLIIQNKPEKAI